MFRLCGEALVVVDWVCLVWTERWCRGPLALDAIETWIRCEPRRDDRLIAADTTRGAVYVGNLLRARRHLSDRI
jgi:hypothetical protein